MSFNPQDPTNAREWQLAVDAAQAANALASARTYGLIEGGPTVNLDRCEDILERGRALGYIPADDAIEQFARALKEAAG